MGQRIAISRDGVFKLDDSAYRIPWTFPRRPVLSYRVLSVDRADPPNESEYSDVVSLELLEEPMEPRGVTP